MKLCSDPCFHGQMQLLPLVNKLIDVREYSSEYLICEQHLSKGTQTWGCAMINSNQYSPIEMDKTMLLCWCIS